MATLVLGPSNVGKSTFMDAHTKKGEPQAFGSQIATHIDVPERGYLHYNLLHRCLALRDAGIEFREWDLLSEPLLETIVSSGRIEKAVVIVAPIEELIERASSRKHFEKALEQSSGYNSALWVEILQAVDFFALYEKTFEMLEAKGINFEVLYSSNEFTHKGSPVFLPSDRTLAHHNLRGVFISAPSRAAIQAVIDLPGRDYQRVMLPRNMSTDTTNFDHVSEGRARTFNTFRDRSFVGRSVLDIGCALGDFLLRYERHGATKLCGVELKPSRWEAAAAIASLMHSKALIHCGNFLEIQLHEQFDDVLILNVLHHVPDFKRFLAKAVEVTRERLIIEYPTLDDNKFQALSTVEGDFEHLPIIGVSNATADQTFVYTQAALVRLIADLGHFSVSSHPSPIKERRILVFERLPG
ncbi:methyltransferase domain-containing protein [Ensifer sp. HO-A22]|uniref:Methyltransferase domain-containing protein n=1 Tax=Ensifer oleiphilus TaxID=2742698 RepID=A0A7Y6UN41_9HYPH|nr:methyltransferase domain-containing protein [Ensifer oleiphilus]NVD39782.1 methyltransferase domain-containing protein [Ensifer oleiphilus]